MYLEFDSIINESTHGIVRSPAVLFHDYFAIRGGGERLVLTLAHALDATLVHGYRTHETYDEADFPKRTRSLNFPSLLRRPGLRPLSLAAVFTLQRYDARRYAVRLFSGVAGLFAAPRKSKRGINVFYCHTPPRFLYDQAAYYLRGKSVLKRLAAYAFECQYRRAVARMDIIVTNSQNTRARIRHYLGRESIVVHPPVETDRFSWRGQGDYYLSTARLTPLKRVDRIVEAFLAMPDKRLIVTSGGEELERLKRLAANAPNIEFRGWVNDTELLDLVGNAIATIYLPVDEDFGMSPVESMAAGKPVIGVAEGGLLETVLPDETGVLLPPQFTQADLIAAVRSMTPAKAEAMRYACEARAKDFSRGKFIATMKQLIDDALAGRSAPRAS
ncbi:glycosyltransferase [Brucella sp. IR073]|uniref:glycosyltransferase n=1 Tax=unclassified Brucella TaxID=2632610 RepID=UPI003B97FB50